MRIKEDACDMVAGILLYTRNSEGVAVIERGTTRKTVIALHGGVGYIFVTRKSKVGGM